MATLSGFFSVHARLSGRVVCRLSGFGSVWAWRAVRSGERPSPACLFFPCGSVAEGFQLHAAARVLGWACEVKPGSNCAVWQSGPLSRQCPPIAAKVTLPVGVSASQAHADLSAALAVSLLAA